MGVSSVIDSTEDATATPRAPQIVRRLWPWVAAATTGALIPIGLPPFDQGWVVWIALVPLLCALWFSGQAGASRWRPFQLGYLAGFIYYAVAFDWLGSLGKLFGSKALLGIPVLLGLYMGLYVGLWAWFVSSLKLPIFIAPPAPNPSPGKRPRGPFMRYQASEPKPSIPNRALSLQNLHVGFLAACVWVIAEWVRGWLFSGFGWNGLGIALHGNLPMIQIADITGVLGLSWLIVFCNVMAVLIVRRIIAELGPQFMKDIRWEFSATMAVVALVFAYGVHALQQTPTDTVDLKVAMLQPNVPQMEKWDAASETKIFDRLDALTQAAALSKPDLIIWPESATPYGVFGDMDSHNFAIEQAQRGEGALLMGTILTEIPDGAYNAAALFTNGGLDVQLYRKIHLVPYGEYLPMRPLLGPVLGGLVPGDFKPGTGPSLVTLTSPHVRLAPLICFEDSLGDLARQFAGIGAQVLVNITNDGWFQKTQGAEQHFVHAIFRAVENRRPLLRCCNTGVTCSVDPAGRVDRWAPSFVQMVPFARTIKAPRNPSLTFYTRCGDWLAWFSCLMVGVFLLGRRRNRNKGRGSIAEKAESKPVAPVSELARS